MKIIKRQQPLFLLLAMTFIGFFAFIVSASANSNDISQIDTQELWLTEKEKLWLKNNKVIRHGMVKGKINLPYEFTNENNARQGITSDYMQFIEEKLGVRIETQYLAETTVDVARALQDGDIDFSTYMPKVVGREKIFTFSEPIIAMPVVLFGHQDSALIHSLAAFEGNELLVQYNSYPDYYIGRYFPLIKMKYVYSTVEGLRAAANKEGVFIHNVFSTEYYMRKHDIQNVKMVGAAGFDYVLMFAATNEMAPFISIIEKAMIELSAREKKLIFDKWINLQIEEKVDIALIIQAILATVAIALIVIGLFFYWNRQLTAKVAKRTKNLRDLAGHMERVREDEKKHLAREIHDELGHTLTALTMSIRQLKDCDDKHQLEDKTKELTSLVKNASKTSKQIMSDLRPSVLEDLGLIAALDWLSEEFSSRNQILCEFNEEESEIELEEEVAIALFRISQESLTNIAKHAQASEVKISICSIEDAVTLSISDNGIGLKEGWSTKEGSFGLQGMKERVTYLGGRLEVNSSAAEGVELKVRIPLTIKTAGA